MKGSHWTKWGILALALLLCIPALALAQSGGRGNFTQNNPQPVLIYTVWGGTLAGDTARTLVVYDNGLSVWSQSDADGTGNNGVTGNSVQAVQISASDINQLRQQLRQAGAFRQRANNGDAPSEDAALITITVFNKSGNRNGTALAQTFSFWEDDDNATRLRINDVFTSFLNTNFGGDSGGSGSGQ